MTEESLGTDVEVIWGAHPCAESADSVSCCLFLEPNTWNMQGNINTAAYSTHKSTYRNTHRLLSALTRVLR